MPDQIVVENGLEFTGKNCRIVLWTDYVPTCGGEGAPCLPYPPQQFIIRIVLTEDDRPATLVKLEQFLCRAAEAKAKRDNATRRCARRASRRSRSRRRRPRQTSPCAPPRPRPHRCGFSARRAPPADGAQAPRRPRPAPRPPSRRPRRTSRIYHREGRAIVPCAFPAAATALVVAPTPIVVVVARRAGVAASDRYR